MPDKRRREKISIIIAAILLILLGILGIKPRHKPITSYNPPATKKSISINNPPPKPVTEHKQTPITKVTTCIPNGIDCGAILTINGNIVGYDLSLYQQ